MEAFVIGFIGTMLFVTVFLLALAVYLMLWLQRIDKEKAAD